MKNIVDWCIVWYKRKMKEREKIKMLIILILIKTVGINYSYCVLSYHNKLYLSLLHQRLGLIIFAANFPQISGVMC